MSNTLLNSTLSSTKNILEKNLDLLNEEFFDEKIVFVYDKNSILSSLISEAYIQNLSIFPNVEIINFDEVDKDLLKEKLLSLKEKSTVILVQSTNFRLDWFRIRLSLNKNWVWCLEHNHLSYIKENETKNYINSISYKTPYFDDLSWKMKSFFDKADKLTVLCKDGSKLEVSGWFEDMKQNTWNYSGINRWSTLPFWENFTESKIFDNVNGFLSIYAYPDLWFKVNFVEPFIIEIKQSKIISWSQNTPLDFIEILEMIKKSEDEIFVRELWFWLNPDISKINPLSDVNSYERKVGFHMSIWKKHGIYRKKIHRKIVQRYHIDIFPDIDKIFLDDKKIFEKDEYTL